MLNRILALPKLVLRKNGKHEPRNRNRTSVHQRIRTRIKLALEGKWQRLLEDATEAFPTRLPSRQHSTQDKITQARRLLLRGAIGKAAQRLSSPVSPVPPTAENAAKLAELHPAPTKPVTPKHRQNLPASYTFTEAEVRRELRGLPFYSAPGPDGLRPSLLQSLAHTPGGTDSQRSPVKELTKFVNSAIDGKLPETMSSWFAGGSLIGMPKDDTDPKLRPLAIGTALRRLISRMLMHKLSQDKELMSYFSPSQMGVGAKSGCETIVHATRHTIEVLSDQDILLVQIDATNAFNAIERADILHEVVVRAPPIARWVHWAYGRATHLLFGVHYIQSRTGTQQGDPLSMLLFALGLHPLIKELEEEFPDLDINAWLADDGTVMGDPDRVAQALQFLIRRGKKRGFDINIIKTKAWRPRAAVPRVITPPQPHRPPPNIPCRFVDAEAIEMLGAPMGTVQGCRVLAKKRIAKVESLWENLTEMDDPQCAYHLLRVCASTCRLIYFLRCTPPHITSPICHNFDNGMRRVFEENHGELTEEMWNIACLPLRTGGLGLTKSQHIKEACYASSVLATAVQISDLLRNMSFPIMQHIQGPLNALCQTWSLPPEYSAPLLIQKVYQGLASSLQHELTDAIHNARSRTVMQQLNANDMVTKRKRIRLQSSSTPNATRPFLTLPNGDTWIQPELWRTTIGLRLGKKFYTGTHICPTCADGNYRSPRILDPDGHHASVCPGSMGTVRRHNALRDMLIKEMSRVPVSIYPQSEWVFHADRDKPANERRRLDFYIDSMLFSSTSHGFDVTIVSPHSAPYSRVAKSTPMTILSQVEDAKLKKYGTLCQAEGVTLCPMGADIYGSLGKKAEESIWKLAEAVAARRGSSPKSEDTRLTLKISLHVLRSVALAINRRSLGTIQNLEISRGL